MSLSQVAVAGNFRVAALRESCASIADQELAAGSKRIPWKNEDPAFIAFQTELMGEEVTVVYLCRDGLLFTENYFFPKKEADQSLEDFRKVYDALGSRYGAAWLDNTPWQSNADPRVIEKDPKQYYVTWRNPEMRITIALIPRNYTSDSKHQVLLIVSADVT
jgi:hypothetical protein